MIISGFQKLALLDYPNKLACIVFTQGCNFKCAYCQNSDLLSIKTEGLIDEKEIFDYLEKRKKVLDGVVITGGEPTIQPNLTLFIQRVKDLGLKVKLDTNGSNPEIIKKLLKEDLVDYIAMDIKTDFDKYGDIIKINWNMDNIKKSIKLIKESTIEHEFRTTINKNDHTIEDLRRICEYLGPDENYYIQNFEQSDYVLDKSLKSFSKDELIRIEKKLKKEFPNVKVRGL